MLPIIEDFLRRKVAILVYKDCDKDALIALQDAIDEQAGGPVHFPLSGTIPEFMEKTIYPQVCIATTTASSRFLSFFVETRNAKERGFTIIPASDVLELVHKPTFSEEDFEAALGQGVM